MMQPVKTKRVHEWKVGDEAKVLVNNRYHFIGEIIDIKDDVATVVVRVYYSSVIDYIPAVSKLDDLWPIINGIGDLDVR